MDFHLQNKAIFIINSLANVILQLIFSKAFV